MGDPVRLHRRRMIATAEATKVRKHAASLYAMPVALCGVLSDGPGYDVKLHRSHGAIPVSSCCNGHLQHRWAAGSPSQRAQEARNDASRAIKRQRQRHILRDLVAATYPIASQHQLRGPARGSWATTSPRPRSAVTSRELGLIKIAARRVGTSTHRPGDLSRPSAHRSERRPLATRALSDYAVTVSGAPDLTLLLVSDAGTAWPMPSGRPSTNRRFDDPGGNPGGGQHRPGAVCR